MFGILSQKKRCYECGKWKDKSEFYKNKTRKDGLQSSCIVCDKKATTKWTEENSDRRNENRRELYSSHPEKDRERERKWRINNHDKKINTKRKWRLVYPEKEAEYKNARRARKKGNGGKFTAQEWQALKEFYDFTCLRCDRREPEIKLTPDHVLPLVKHGVNSIDNIQPLCGSCNSAKGTKTIDYRPKN